MVTLWDIELVGVSLECETVGLGVVETVTVPSREAVMVSEMDFVASLVKLNVAEPGESESEPEPDKLTVNV